MKTLFIVANWKSNKTISETEKWLHDFDEKLKRENISLENKEIIVSLSFTLLEHANYCSSNLKLPLKFAAQNISPFEEGAYTGEVSAKQIKEFADYVLIGHSERRKNFLERDEMLFKKVELAKQYGLIPIFCIQGKDTKVPKDVEIVAYEPVFAIGTGNPDTPESAEKIANYIKVNTGVRYIFYGGSVTSANIKKFTKMPNIDGALVGGASLDPRKFLEIVANA